MRTEMGDAVVIKPTTLPTQQEVLMNSICIVRTAIGLSIVAILFATPAHLLSEELPPNMAATFWTHDPSTPGIWFNANNWSNGAPNANLAAVINNGGTAVIDLDPAFARTVFLGGANRSEIDQVGGSLEVVENMWLGRFGRLGQYNLAAGQVSSRNTFISSGWHATDAASGWLGSFFNQTGGDNTVGETLHVGWPLPIFRPAPHPVPHLLSNIDVETVVAEVMAPSFSPIRPIAVYLQTAGTLSTGRTFVGFGGTGVVGQTGGINEIREGLHVGGGYNAFPTFLPNGIFVQTGGVTLAGSGHVGQSGSGLVIQTGGHLGISGNMRIGGTSPWWPHPRPLDPVRLDGSELTFAPVRPDGKYTMSDGSLATNNTEIGLNGKFHQIWGTHDVAGSLLIGGHPQWPWPIPIPLEGTADPTGIKPSTGVDPVPVHPPIRTSASYILDNGELNAGWVHVGQRGRGNFAQNGGTATVRHALRVGGFWWWWPGLLEQSSLEAGIGTGALVAPNHDLHRLPPNATYALNDGDLSTRVSDVSGGGTFRQRGGNHDTHLLQIGGFPFWPVSDADHAVESQASTSGDILSAAIAPVDPAIRPIPDIEPWLRSGGTYIMHGGRLTADRVEVGHGGSGKMIQRGGSVVVSGELHVGSNFWWPWPWLNSAEPVAVAPEIGVILPAHRPFPLDATYTLHRGDLTTVATQLGGTSQFNQTGGKHKIKTVLRIGGFPNWPTPLATGDLTRPEIWPVPVPFRSRYNMSSGELFVGRMEIGVPSHPWIALPAGSTNKRSFAPPRRTGTFRQTGGRVEISSTLNINGGGNYNLVRGRLNARMINVNGGFDFFSNEAVLHQSGGRLKVNKINIGAEAFILGDGGVTDPNESVVPTIAPSVPPTQRYALSGGVVESENILLGGPGRSQLTQTGGELNVGNSLHIVGPSASYSIADGLANVGDLRVGTGAYQRSNSGLSATVPHALGAHLAIGPDADVTIHRNLVFGPDSTLRAATGSTVVMRGATFQNLSTNENALSALNRLTVEFGSGVFTDPLSTFEVGGEDFGFSNEGFHKNFALDTLQVGSDGDVTQLQLIDVFDNQSDWVGDEALYVTNLIVGSGSTLDLNGLNIYYINGSFGDGGGIINSRLGGSPSVPEPAAVLMLGCGMAIRILRRC